MFGSYVRALREYPPDVRIILIVSAISSFTMDGVVPVVFNLYLLRMGFGPAFVGLVNSIALLVFSVASLPAGTLGARYGARTVMVWGVAITLVSAWAIAITDLLPRAIVSAWVIGAFSLLYLGIALYWVNSSPALINLSAHSEQSRVISVQSAFGNLLAFVASPLAGLIPVAVVALSDWSLDDPAPYRYPLMMAGLIYIVALILIVRIKPVPVHTWEREGDTPGAPPVAIVFGGTLIVTSLIRFLVVAGLAVANTFFNVYMDEGMGVSAATIGIVLSMARLSAVFAALMVPAVMRRFGSATTAVFSSLATGLAILPMAFIPLWQVGGLSYLAMQSFTSFRYTALYIYLMSITPPQLRTTMTGAGEFSGGLSFAFFSFIGGIVIVRYGFAALFIIGAATTMLGALWLWIYVRRRERRATQYAL